MSKGLYHITLLECIVSEKKSTELCHCFSLGWNLQGFVFDIFSMCLKLGK